MKATVNVEWIDCAKGLGILLVVYGHVARGLVSSKIMADDIVFRSIDAIIYAFHMPLFFFVSGIFFISSLERRGRGGLFLNKIDTILYIYAIWSIIQGSIEVALSSVTNGHATWMDVAKSLWEPRGQFWFLFALFFIFCISIIIYRRDRTSSALLALALGTSVYFSQKLYSPAPTLGYITSNFVFFAIGVAFNKWGPRFEKMVTARLIFYVALFVATQALIYLMTGVERGQADLRSLTLALLGIASTLSISVLAARSQQRWLITVGAMSMSIFLMHIIAGSGARVILSRYAGISNEYIHLVVGFGFAVMVPIVAVKLLPRMGLGFLFGPPKFIAVSNRARFTSGPPLSAGERPRPDES
ncbi:acyltransferase family protein [Stenotrophomonas sp. NPDC078853]|uniref:acyltransferase family protein n=1 Tax=Stenotrophomonas sp. NPDC078853 TaxID=3364534 RepID=UPI00384A71E8